MAEIPAPINFTVEAINEAIVRRARPDGDSAGVPMSDATNECDRAIWYAFHWAAEREMKSASRESRFETGRYWETILIQDLVDAGISVSSQQETAELAGGFLRGKLDGIAESGVPDAPKTRHVVECKSLKAADWRAIVKHGLAKAKPDHFAQCQLYMRAKGLDRCLYVCVNKDTDDRHVERIPYDASLGLATEARIERIVGLSEPPPRAFEDPNYFRCKLCRERSICHENAFARVNCRTCLHATPKTPKSWSCQQSSDLKYSDQQRGCAHHRYIPALVPGEQTDIIEFDLIVYRMPDGSQWIDGQRESAA